MATALLQGRQDIFWPPVTGWLIALVRLVTQSDGIAVVRLAWIAMDAACVALVWVIARRLGRSLWPGDQAAAGRLAMGAAMAYAVYLPAIAYSEFATSEIPALLGVLGTIVLMTSARPSVTAFAAAGAVAGLLCLTRPSLLPLLGLLPLATVRRARWAPPIAFALVGATVVGAYVYRNWHYAGELTISTNSAYNLFIGNRDMYAEDLDLLSPRATPEQIEFRRQQFSGQLPPFTQSPAESQRLAVEWIREHPGLFLRRAAGRLARVLVPKTDVLELLGGESRAGVFTARSLVLLMVTNLQWTIVLFGGLVGLFALRYVSPGWAWLFTSVVTGSLLLCVVAISKPRYSFVFDPLLMVSAAALWLDRARMPARLARADRIALAVAVGFILWGWIAFAIFAVSSRSTI